MVSAISAELRARAKARGIRLTAKRPHSNKLRIKTPKELRAQLKGKRSVHRVARIRPANAIGYRRACERWKRVNRVGRGVNCRYLTARATRPADFSTKIGRKSYNRYLRKLPR